MLCTACNRLGLSSKSISRAVMCEPCQSPFLCFWEHPIMIAPLPPKSPTSSPMTWPDPGCFAPLIAKPILKKYRRLIQDPGLKTGALSRLRLWRSAILRWYEGAASKPSFGSGMFFSGQQLTGEQFTTNERNWRRIGHIIADAIYKTADRGIWLFR